MKKLILLVLLVMLIPTVMAVSNTVTLPKGYSHVIENNNITLMDFNSKEDRAVICVNNQKQIVVKREKKKVGEVYVELRSFENQGVRFRFEADCEDCVIKDNSVCFPKVIEKPEINEPKVEEDSDNEPEIETPIVEDSEKSYKGILHKFFSWIVSLFS